jgi:hypothetical protein
MTRKEMASSQPACNSEGKNPALAKDQPWSSSQQLTEQCRLVRAEVNFVMYLHHQKLLLQFKSMRIIKLRRSNLFCRTWRQCKVLHLCQEPYYCPTFVGVLYKGSNNGEDDLYMWRRLRRAHCCLSLPYTWFGQTTADKGTMRRHWLLPEQEKATYTIYYGGAPAPIPKEKALWNIWWVEPEHS